MAADLHIHVMTDDMTEADLADFFCSTLGSKYFNPMKRQDFDGPSWERVSESPSVHVGEVSWLKAALFDDRETFVPDAVAGVSEAIGERLPEIDDNLIAKIAAALKLDNTTSYDVSSDNEIIAFLAEHKGKKAFTVSW